MLYVYIYTYIHICIKSNCLYFPHVSMGTPVTSSSALYAFQEATEVCIEAAGRRTEGVVKESADLSPGGMGPRSCEARHRIPTPRE